MKYNGFCLLAAACLASTIRAGAANPQNSLRIAVSESEANAAEYRGVHQSSLGAWLQRNHDDFEVIGDHTASDPVKSARFAAVISTSNCIVPDTAAAGLAAFVKAGGRLRWIDTVRGQGASCRKWLGPDKLLLINVYASGSSGTKEPGPRSPKYLRDILGISRQACDGIRLYCLPKNDFDDARFRVVAELFGKRRAGIQQPGKPEAR